MGHQTWRMSSSWCSYPGTCRPGFLLCSSSSSSSSVRLHLLHQIVPLMEGAVTAGLHRLMHGAKIGLGAVLQQGKLHYNNRAEANVGRHMWQARQGGVMRVHPGAGIPSNSAGAPAQGQGYNTHTGYRQAAGLAGSRHGSVGVSS
jgi:hypothetical protein